MDGVSVTSLRLRPVRKLSYSSVTTAMRAVMVMLSDTSVDCVGDLLSETSTVNMNVPLAVGDPLIVPVEFKVNPAGSAPFVMLQL